MDIRNIEFSSHELCFIKIGDLLKTSSIHFHKEELKFPADEKDRNISPVNYIKNTYNLLNHTED